MPAEPQAGRGGDRDHVQALAYDAVREHVRRTANHAAEDPAHHMSGGTLAD